MLAVVASPKLSLGRWSQIGSLFAVTAVTRNRKPIFANPSLARIVSEEIKRCDEEGLVESYAWVVMPDHVHWLFALRTASLGDCVRTFKSRSARSMNALTETQGRVWQSGYYDHRLRSDEDLITQARYLVENPLRRRLVSRIEDYPHWWCRWIKASAHL